MTPVIFWSAALRQRLQRFAQRRTANWVQHSVDGVHPVRHQADVQPALREVGLGLVEEAVRIGNMPGDAAELLQISNRMPARLVQHLVLVEKVLLVSELVSQVAQERGGLVADLTPAQGEGDLGQRFQLPADAKAI